VLLLQLSKGIKGIQVAEMRVGSSSSSCFHIQALDGTLEDFSYRKCLLALFPGEPAEKGGSTCCLFVVLLFYGADDAKKLCLLALFPGELAGWRVTVCYTCSLHWLVTVYGSVTAVRCSCCCFKWKECCLTLSCWYSWLVVMGWAVSMQQSRDKSTAAAVWCHVLHGCVLRLAWLAACSNWLLAAMVFMFLCCLSIYHLEYL
jgi:hypothetical protein